jgi:hypothetical protein
MSDQKTPETGRRIKEQIDRLLQAQGIIRIVRNALPRQAAEVPAQEVPVEEADASANVYALDGAEWLIAETVAQLVELSEGFEEPLAEQPEMDRARRPEEPPAGGPAAGSPEPASPAQEAVRSLDGS